MWRIVEKKHVAGYQIMEAVRLDSVHNSSGVPS